MAERGGGYCTCLVSMVAAHFAPSRSSSTIAAIFFEFSPSIVFIINNSPLCLEEDSFVLLCSETTLDGTRDLCYDVFWQVLRSMKSFLSLAHQERLSMSLASSPAHW
jgi:hypothetical protein